MKILTHASVPIYTVSGADNGQQLPQWLARKRRKSLKKSTEYTHRVELLQDFEFDEASVYIQISEDGEWIMSTGTYKPQMHVHNLQQLSLSYSRHTNSLNEKFVLLSSDYSKSLHLQVDRTLEFHTPQGLHYSTRIPRYGRDLVFCRKSANALISLVGQNAECYGEVLRLNLELGRFLKSFQVDIGHDNTLNVENTLEPMAQGSVNVVAVAEASHNLHAFGTSLATVEFWDPRSRNRVALLKPVFDDVPLTDTAQITALTFHSSGLSMAVGSSTGLTHIYDLRSSSPLIKKDQGYGNAIKTIQFLEFSSAFASQTSDPKVMTSDKRIIKIWGQNDGKAWTSVEPTVDLNHVVWYPNSGMILTANEGSQQHAFFIPQLAPAPAWCSFLDNIVEEMAEDPNDPNAFAGQKQGVIYDNFKFLTVAQLTELNLDHLIGKTRLLHPYMHGYFIPQTLYEEARIIANPNFLREQKEQSIREKIEKERESRIRGKKLRVKVNKDFLDKLKQREEKNERRKAARRANQVDNDGDKVGKSNDIDEREMDAFHVPVGQALLRDSRFSSLFQDTDFEIDSASREYQVGQYGNEGE